MEILIGASDKRRNSTKQYTPQVSVEGYLKTPTNVINPVVQIRDDRNLSNFNVAYIPEFRRYYYITDWVSVNAHMWEARMEVDVLTTYREHIFSTFAFVIYSESAWWGMIPDGRVQKTVACGVTLDVKMGWTPWSGDGSYIISVASKDSSGTNGVAQVMATTVAGMSQLATALLNKDLLQKLFEYFNGNPLNCVVSCKWFPVNYAVWHGSPSSTIQIGEETLNVSGKILTANVESGDMIMYCHPPYKTKQPDGSYTYGDYRNTEPYTQWSIMLPGVGMVQLPMIKWLGYGPEEPKVTLNWHLSPTSGEIVWELLWSDVTSMIVSGNLAEDVPLATSESNVGGVLSSVMGILGGVGAATVGVITGSIPAIAGGIISGGLSAMNATTSAVESYQTSGRCGGKAGAHLAKQIEISYTTYATSDSPSNLADVIGAPTFAKKKLGDLHGFVQCAGAYVSANCTQREHDMLSDFLNAGKMNSVSYGGVYIE